MKEEKNSSNGVLSNLSNLSDLQNASKVAVNQQDVINVEGYLTCHIDTDKLPKILQQVLNVSDDNAVKDMLLADDYGISQVTATRWICQRVEAGEAVRVSQGHYKKGA